MSGQGGEARRSSALCDSEHPLLALAASDGVARDILAQHGAEEEAIRGRLASLVEREAPEIAAKLRAPSAAVSASGRAQSGERVRDLIPFVHVTDIARSIESTIRSASS